MSEEMQFRFTLTNTTLGSRVISEPIGWDDAELTLERDPEFFGVVEFYDQPVTFYRDSFDGVDGGYDYIKSVLDNQGQEADVTFRVEISEDAGDTFEVVFDGLLDLASYLEIDSYQLQIPIIRNDFWSRFIARRNVSVNLMSTTDLDGGTRPVLTPPNILLTSQKIRQEFEADHDNTSVLYSATVYGNIDFLEVDKDEIKKKFNYPRIANSARPNELFQMEVGGTLNISCQIHATSTAPPDAFTSSFLDVKIQKNEDAATNFTKTDEGTGGIDGRTKYTYSATITVDKGDLIRIYFQATGSSSWRWLPNSSYASFIDIIGDTTFPDTYSDAFLAHEAFQAVIDRITGKTDSFISDFFGHANTQRRAYGSDGCGAGYVVCRGVHIRGYDITEKIMSANFDELWQTFNPIFCLGLQYTTDGSGNEVIEITQREDLFSSSISLTLADVNEVEESYDTSNTYKNIKIGYEKWEAESFSGIDDPQTKREYSSPLKKSGDELTIYSKAIGAGIAIEATRRQTIEKGADYKLDNDMFIIALDRSSLIATPPVYTPDFDDEFDTITNLLNSDARYNIRITPSRNFLEWRKFLDNAFPFGGSYKFVRGEGNYKMGSRKTTSDGCGASLSVRLEDADISIVASSAYFRPYRVEFEHPLSWTEYKSIAKGEGRNKRIAIINLNRQYYIESVRYKPTRGKAKFKLMEAAN